MNSAKLINMQFNDSQTDQIPPSTLVAPLAKCLPVS